MAASVDLLFKQVPDCYEDALASCGLWPNLFVVLQSSNVGGGERDDVTGERVRYTWILASMSPGCRCFRCECVFGF
jgi:hypothetical protein